MQKLKLQLLYLAAALGAGGQAWAGPCMVLGEKAAVVYSEEGEKSPAFLTQACERLKLKSGKAMVSWVGSDGKPQMAPIALDGVTRYPAAGSEERSAKVVWAEITTRREVPRAAVMRNMTVNEVRPATVYVPPEGVEIRPDSGVAWQLSLGRSGSTEVLPVKAVGPGRFVLDRNLLRAGHDYLLTWSGGAVPLQWTWRVLPEAQTAALDDNYTTLMQVDLDTEQRNLMKAMWFEQLRLPLNMNLILKGMP